MAQTNVDCTRVFTLTRKSDGLPYDPGSPLKMQLKRGRGSTADLELSTTNGMLVSVPGSLTIVVPWGTIKALTPANYQFDVVHPVDSTHQTGLFRGVWNIRPGITNDATVVGPNNGDGSTSSGDIQVTVIDDEDIVIETIEMGAPGLIPGGNVDDVPVKHSASDYDTRWKSPGALTFKDDSVNGNSVTILTRATEREVRLAHDSRLVFDAAADGSTGTANGAALNAIIASYVGQPTRFIFPRNLGLGVKTNGINANQGTHRFTFDDGAFVAVLNNASATGAFQIGGTTQVTFEDAAIVFGPSQTNIIDGFAIPTAEPDVLFKGKTTVSGPTRSGLFSQTGASIEAEFFSCTNPTSYGFNVNGQLATKKAYVKVNRAFVDKSMQTPTPGVAISPAFQIQGKVAGNSRVLLIPFEFSLSHILSKETILPKKLTVSDATYPATSNVNLQSCYGYFNDINSLYGSLGVTFGHNLGRIRGDGLYCKANIHQLVEIAGQTAVVQKWLTITNFLGDGTDDAGNPYSSTGLNIHSGSATDLYPDYVQGHVWGTRSFPLAITDGVRNVHIVGTFDASSMDASYASNLACVFLPGRSRNGLRQRGPFNVRLDINAIGGGIGTEVVHALDAAGLFGTIHCEGFVGPQLVNLIDDGRADPTSDYPNQTCQVNLTLNVGNGCPAGSHLALRAQSASGALYGAALSDSEQDISNWTAIAAGQFKIAADGGAVQNVTCGSFAGATTLDDVAAVVQTAVQALGIVGGADYSAATVVWNKPTASQTPRFVFTSGTSGTSSKIVPLTAGTANDISAQLKCTTAAGATEIDGSVGQFGDDIQINGQGFKAYAAGYVTEVLDASGGLIRAHGSADPEGVLDGAQGSEYLRTGVGKLTKTTPKGIPTGWQDPIKTALFTTSYDPATAAFLARTAFNQLPAQKTLYDALISGWRADGDLASIKGAWVLGAADEATGFLNLISSIGSLSKVGSGSTFTVNRGFLSDGATSLASATAILAALGLAQDNLELIVFTGTDRAATNEYGVSISGASASLRLNPKTAGSNFQTQCNSLTVVNTAGAPVSTVCAFSLIRDASANYRIGVNGLVAATVTDPSAGLPGSSLSIGLSGATYSRRTIFGFLLSDASRGDAGTLRKVNRMRTFETAVGAPN